MLSSVSVQFLYSFCHTFRTDTKREVPASGLVCLPCLLLPPAVRLCRPCGRPSCASADSVVLLSVHSTEFVLGLPRLLP